jgi:hypothetical protein
MLISELKLRQIIKKRLLSEGAPLAIAALIAIPKVAQWIGTSDPQDKVDDIMNWNSGGENVYDSLLSGFKAQGKEPILISVGQADAVANTLFEATKGGLFNLGFGTSVRETGDGESIEGVFTQARNSFTLMDIGLIARRFWENHANAFIEVAGFGIGGTAGSGAGEQLSLYEVLQDELLDGDYKKYVKNLLISERNLSGSIPLARFEDGTEIYLDELKEGTKEVVEDEDDKIEIDSLSGNTVEKIEYVLKKYAEKFSLSEVEGFTPDSSWDRSTDNLYLIDINHGFDNHLIFKKLGDASEYAGASLEDLKWKSILSPYLQLQGYPGYTSGAKGLLRFLVDLYNGEDNLGKQSISITPTPAPIKTRTKVRDEEPEQSVSASKGKVTSRNISISVVGAPEGNKLEDFGGSTAELSQILIDKLKGGNYSGDTINMSVELNRQGQPKSVRPARGQKAPRSFEKINSVILNYLKRINFVSTSTDKRRKVSARKSVELVLRFPPGRYR